MNWWKSIRDRGSQIKGYNNDWVQDVFIVVAVFLVGISAFGLGRLSATEESKPAIRMIQNTMENEEPIRIGGKVVASKNGSRYHFPWCGGANRINEKNKIWFGSIDDARRAGYTPAGNCKGLR